MLDNAFDRLGPLFAARYRALIEREFANSPELDPVHRVFRDYALLDCNMPRPVLAYFGRHATSDAVDFTDVERVGEGLLVAQLLRDVLAIRDDVVDEDLDKFGSAPLPVALSGAARDGTAPTKRGKDLATYYADFLIGVMLRLVARQAPTVAAAITGLLGDTLYTNQRGQLAELLAEDRPVDATDVDEVLLWGERKAAYYCYAFPFDLGAIQGGHDLDRLVPVRKLLIRIGTASQVIDDLTGAFPGMIDDDKDTLGEIVHLRRTIPLVLLAHRGDLGERARALLVSPPPLAAADAAELRALLRASGAPLDALHLGEQLLVGIEPLLDNLPIGRAPHAYLNDLVDHRIRRKLKSLRSSLASGSSS